LKDIEAISEKVEKRKTQLEPLFKKDQENYDLWAGKEQIFDNHKMSVNITGTEMTALSRRVLASLVRSRLDIHVLPPGALPNPDAVKNANQEERMYYYGFDKADERLSMQGKPKLRPATAWQAIVLGRTTVRVVVYRDKDTGEIIWDFRPMIPSLVAFEFDDKGLAWYRYETFRSPAAIKSEYGKDVSEETQGKGISVSDYWDREHNVRYLTKSKEALSFEVNGKKVTSWEHELEEVPAIIEFVSGGPEAITSEGIDVTAWGQSIFDPVKIPFRNLNKLRSIVATQGHFVAKRPLEEIYEEGIDPNIEEEDIDYHPGALIKHPKSIELKPMDVSTIDPSILAMMGDLSTNIQRATYTDLPPGNTTGAYSGSALRIIGQDKRDVETPRVETLNTLHTRICQMAKRQILARGLTIPVKTVVNGAYQVYEMTPEFIDNDFYVGAELIRRDVYDEEALLQKAQMKLQLGLASREDVMEEDLSIQDVPARMFKINWEKIRDEIPQLRLKEMIKVLEEDMQLPEEAAMLKKKLAMLDIQEQQALMGQGGMGQPPGQPGGARPTGVPT
jgi:hypothetical protein